MERTDLPLPPEIWAATPCAAQTLGGMITSDEGSTTSDAAIPTGTPHGPPSGEDRAAPHGAVSRRTLLKGAAAAAALVGARGADSAVAAPAGQRGGQADVAVVGAGISGLTA